MRTIKLIITLASLAFVFGCDGDTSSNPAIQQARKFETLESMSVDKTLLRSGLKLTYEQEFSDARKTCFEVEVEQVSESSVILHETEFTPANTGCDANAGLVGRKRITVGFDPIQILEETAETNGTYTAVTPRADLRYLYNDWASTDNIVENDDETIGDVKVSYSEINARPFLSISFQQYITDQGPLGGVLLKWVDRDRDPEDPNNFVLSLIAIELP